jgi:hypothetical protein
VRDLAAKYFRDESRTIVTLSTKAKDTATKSGQEDEE